MKILDKLQLRNLIIFLYGILIIDFLSFHKSNASAEFFTKNFSEEINKTNDFSKSKLSKSFNKSISYIQFDVLKELEINSKKLMNFLAFEETDTQEENFVEIEAETQYRENDIFYAEGNAVIYLSNASLKGDFIKYDTKNKLLTVDKNVVFKKGNQYFQATKLFYDLEKDTGYIDNVYGLLDSKTFTDDFKIEIKQEKEEIINEYRDDVSKPKYVNTATIGLVNQFEKDKNFNIKKAEIKIPKISRWRYRTSQLTYDSKTIKSKKIFFTNDIYNEPQFIFQSNNFSAEIKESKLRLLSRNSWIILDNTLKVPIGRRSVFDKDPLTKWGFGADFKDKDGYYLFRGTYPRKIFKDYSFQIQPYFLIQRVLQGNTNAYTAKNASIFSKTVSSDLKISDYLAFDINIDGLQNKWSVDSLIQLSSLNSERLDQSLRSKLTISRSFNLNKKKDDDFTIQDNDVTNDFSSFQDGNFNQVKPYGNEIENKLIKLYSKKKEDEFSNFLDLKFYNIFREKVTKDFATEEIYFASGFSISNKKSWFKNDKNTNLSLIYDIGNFKAKSRTEEEFKELFRNTFVAQYNYKFPIWKKFVADKTIDESYKFSPIVVNQSIDWSSGIQSGLFFYSDGSSQVATKFNTGPIITLGALKRKFLDYTYLSANFNYVLKDGDSPFAFDNINKDPKINFNYEQQIFGPLVFGLQTSLNLDNGDFSNPYYALDFKRRAYAIGAFYNSVEESLGIKFNIFNFDYSGLAPKF